MTISKETVEKLFELIKPKCPYCDADVSYAYYGYDGSKYCPNCLKKLSGD